MNENNISYIIKNLTSTIIQEHLNKKLGTTNMKDYILNKYPNLNSIQYNKIVLGIGKELAHNGYEIKVNIEKFDIINFRNNDYIKYLYELKKSE